MFNVEKKQMIMLKSQKKNSHTKAEKFKFVTSENAGTKQWNRPDRRSVQR